MKQSEMIMQVIKNHQKKEAKIMRSMIKIDEEIASSGSSEFLMSVREHNRKRMMVHRNFIKELAPIVGKEVKFIHNEPTILV